MPDIPAPPAAAIVHMDEESRQGERDTSGFSLVLRSTEFALGSRKRV